MKKIFLSLLSLIVIVILALAWVVTRVPSSAFDGQAAPGAEQALLTRGEYVARTADCVACHSVPNGKPFAGGLKMGTPIGAIYSTNITPDPADGIGRYSLADFDRAVRHGVAPGGERLYPAMPYPSYAKMSDEDIRALYAFFMHSVPAQAVPDKASEIAWPLNMRWPLALWNIAFVGGGPYQDSAGKDAEWNRGAYLVQGPGHCGSCHTPRGIAMNEKALSESSKIYLSGALLDGWYAPSLRNDPNSGLGRWSEQDVYDFLKTGRNAHGVVFGSMADAFNNSTQYMTDADLHAIAHYLKSLPGDPARDGAPYQPQVQQAALGFALPGTAPGAATYATKCAFCHGPMGQGQAPWIPPLAGATSSLLPEAASQINVVLNGSARVVAQGMPDSYRMPPYRGQLSDRDIADVLGYIRGQWGNTGGKVDPAAVGDLRKRTDPASSNVIVLQMR